MTGENAPTSFRLSTKARHVLKALVTELGVNQTAVIEIAIRDLAERKLKQGPNPEAI